MTTDLPTLYVIDHTGAITPIHNFE